MQYVIIILAPLIFLSPAPVLSQVAPERPDTATENDIERFPPDASSSALLLDDLRRENVELKRAIRLLLRKVELLEQRLAESEGAE